MQEQHPNLVLIHRFFEAYSRYDLEEIKKILAPGIEWFIPGANPMSGMKVGPDQVLDYLRQVGKFGFQAKPLVLGVNDDYVIDCHLNWSNQPGGDNVEFMSCLLWKIEEGKITKVYNFPQDQHLVDAFFNRF